MVAWEELNMPGFEARVADTRTVILPMGALEEHGPHLPLGTDTLHAMELARRAARLRPVVVAPALFYGVCRSTREHPGTVSLSGDTLRRLLVDLGKEFYRQGFRNLVFLSGHAGGTHMAAVTEAGEALLESLPEVRVAVVSVLDLLREVFAARPELVMTTNDAHAGAVETSLMLAAFPRLVSGSAPAEWPSFPRHILVRNKRRYWPGGVWGDPGPADATRGEAILAAEALRLAEVISSLEAWEE